MGIPAFRLSRLGGEEDGNLNWLWVSAMPTRGGRERERLSGLQSMGARERDLLMARQSMGTSLGSGRLS